MTQLQQRWLFTATVGAARLVASAQPAAQNLPRFEKTAQCPFTPGDWAATVRLECGYLVVPRVRERPADGTLKIAVAIVHPLEGSTGIPLVLPHGGPSGPGGLRGGEMTSAWHLAPRLKRDVIVYDERGAGLSEPPLCPNVHAETPVARNLPREERVKIWNQTARMCAMELRKSGFDPAMFSTATNAADLIDLRKALGYRSWDVFGVSYGSRVAQEVMRRDPEGIRSAILSAPVMPGPSQELEAPIAFQRVMDHVVAACVGQPSCAGAFPTIAKDLDALYADLNAHPLNVVFDTASGSSTVPLDGERLIHALHSGFAQRVSRVPLIINELLRGDRMSAARVLLGYASVAPGNNTLTDLVGCFESGGPDAIKEILPKVRAETRAMFQTMVNTEEECPIWQQKFAAPADRAFVESGIPTLILTSEFDDRTPTDYGRRIAVHLTHAYVVELPGLAHGQSHPCQQAITRSFLDNPSQPPDTACLAEMKPMVFELKNVEPVNVVLTIASEGSDSSPFAGVWDGNFPNAPVLYRFEFTTNGKDLRGVINAGAQAFPILDARIDGETMMFKTKIADGERTITFTGKIDGDRIVFTRDVAVRPGGKPGGAALWGASGAPTFALTRRGQVALPAQTPKPATDPAKAEAFSAAVRKGDLAAVKQLLDAGVDVNTRFRYDVTAISWASDRGYAEIVKLLIERGADVNAKDTFYNATPLTWAAGPAQARTPGHAEVVRLLLKAGATGNGAALSAAVSAKDAPMVKVILDHGGLGEGPLTNALEAARGAKASDIEAMLVVAGAKPAPVLDLTAAQLEKYVGTYESPASMQIMIKIVDGRLQLDGSRLGAPADIVLVARSETRFAATSMPGLTVTFEIQDGKVTSVSVGAGKYVKKEARP